jgi:hypothetical protein
MDWAFSIRPCASEKDKRSKRIFVRSLIFAFNTVRAGLCECDERGIDGGSDLDVLFLTIASTKTKKAFCNEFLVDLGS